MTDIASFSARLNLDEAVVRRVLESESSAAGRSMPWYVLLLLGLGAWITALIMIVFVAVFLDFVVGFDEPGLGSAAIGVVMFLGGLLIEAKLKGERLRRAVRDRAGGGRRRDRRRQHRFRIREFLECRYRGDGADGDRHLARTLRTAAVPAGRSCRRDSAIAALSDAMVAGRVDIVALALPIGALLYLRPAAEGRAADRDGAAAGHAVLCRRGGHAVRPDLWLRQLAGARHRDGHDPGAGLAARPASRDIAGATPRISFVADRRSRRSASCCRPADRRRWRS